MKDFAKIVAAVAAENAIAELDGLASERVIVAAQKRAKAAFKDAFGVDWIAPAALRAYAASRPRLPR